MRNLVVLDESSSKVHADAPSAVAHQCLTVDSTTGVVYVVTAQNQLVGYAHSSQKVFKYREAGIREEVNRTRKK